MLSIDEVNKYFSTDNQRVAAYKGGSSSVWWLRSPGHYPFLAAHVFSHSNLSVDGELVSFNFGVRPALWVKY